MIAFIIVVLVSTLRIGSESFAGPTTVSMGGGNDPVQFFGREVFSRRLIFVIDRRRHPHR